MHYVELNKEINIQILAHYQAYFLPFLNLNLGYHALWFLGVQYAVIQCDVGSGGVLCSHFPICPWWCLLQL